MLTIAVLTFPPIASAQSRVDRLAPAPVSRDATAPRVDEVDDRAGPRVGIAAILGGSVTAEREGRAFTPITTLFGWQSEHQFDSGLPGLVPVSEVIGMVGGIEQGILLPSLSWLIGVRQPSGWEIAGGPMLTGAGTQLMIAAGVTHHVGRLNVPINVAVAPGRRGASISVTSGFNVRGGR